MKNIAILTMAALLAGCGTFQLSSGAVPPAGKTKDQMALDNLICKDKAQLAIMSAGSQLNSFLLGLTIIGAPLAYEIEKANGRRVYKDCMEAAGYQVYPPLD